jgi:uncharacterized protein
MRSPAQSRGWPHPEPAFHPGEQALQARAGVGEHMSAIGARVMRTAMPDEHRELFEKLPFLLLGALDAERRPWATALVGAPGFVRTPDATSLVVGALPLTEGALRLSLEPGAPVGLLGIQPSTRRRNRVNGVIRALGGDALSVEVRQSFGNCPKYIQARELEVVTATVAAPSVLGARLSAEAIAAIARADTFFIASASPDAGLPQQAPSDGVDVSHRGGKPGFVHVDEVDGAMVLTAPDFSGNYFFNTLGNLALDPRAGLLFIDWQSGDVLTLTGTTEVVWDGPEVRAFAGAQRLLRIRVVEGRWLPGAMPLRATQVEYASQLAATGSWDPTRACRRHGAGGGS